MIFSFHKLHKWLGILLAIPILLVCITAILLAHDKMFGLKDLRVNASWLPAYGPAVVKAKRQEIKAVLVDAEDRIYIGTKGGLFVLHKGEITEFEALRGLDVRAIIPGKETILVATKQGLWMSQEEKWRRIFAGDVHGVSVAKDGAILVAIHKQGLLISRNEGRSWRGVKKAKIAIATLPPWHVDEKVKLEKLIKDLHTGKALLTKEWDWLWIDLISLTIMILTLVGVYIWWKKQRLKAYF